jgi:hypothetical protein
VDLLDRRCVPALSFDFAQDELLKGNAVELILSEVEGWAGWKALTSHALRARAPPLPFYGRGVKRR